MDNTTSILDLPTYSPQLVNTNNNNQNKGKKKNHPGWSAVASGSSGIIKRKRATAGMAPPPIPSVYFLFCAQFMLSS